MQVTSSGWAFLTHDPFLHSQCYQFRDPYSLNHYPTDITIIRSDPILLQSLTIQALMYATSVG